MYAAALLTTVNPVVMLLGAACALISAPSGSRTDQQSSLTEKIITKPYEEFCSSGHCTYTVPPELLEHLKDKYSEIAWRQPDGGFLADPSQPNKLHSTVINVTLDSLMTKQHADGVWIDIHNHNTNKRFKIIFRAAVNSTRASLTTSDLPRYQIIVLAVVVVLSFLAVFLVCRYHESICRVNLKKVLPKYYQHIKLPNRGEQTLDHCYTAVKDSLQTPPPPSLRQS
ncbi:hypothetical protein MHYP_G00309640 [Metynnis hypsauchen]